MFAVIVQVIVLLILVSLLFWVMRRLETPAEIQRIVLIVIVVLGVLWLCYQLLHFAGVAPALG